MTYFPPRQERNYFIPAVIALALYFAGAYIAGLLATLYFLHEASRDEAAGVQVYNAGCLNVLLWLAMAPLVAIALALALQGLEMLF